MRKGRRAIFIAVPLILLLLAGGIFLVTRQQRQSPDLIYSRRSPVVDVGSNAGSREEIIAAFYPSAPEDGLYYLNIYFRIDSRDRYFDVTVNGETMQVPVPGGDWAQVRHTRVLVPLNAGRNTLQFGNADWFAPNLIRISIEKGREQMPLPTQESLREFQQGDIRLYLCEIRGTYTVVQAGRVLLQDAFAALRYDGRQIFSHEYATHEITVYDDQITVTHTAEQLPTLVQRFWLGEDHLLTSVELLGGATNWISPLYTTSENSLTGGTHFLRVPFDNDDFTSFDPIVTHSASQSYSMTALLCEESNSAVVIGSVTHDTWKTGIEWNSLTNHFTVFGGAADAMTRDTQPHGTVRGEVVASPTVFIGLFSDWRDGLNAYGQANAAVAPPLPWEGGAPLGWNSWGVVQSQLNRETAHAVSDYYREHFQDVWDDVMFINLDAYWNHAPAFPTQEHLRAFVEHVNANGQRAGIYHTPFVCWNSEDQLRDHPYYEALLRDSDGNILPSWSGAFAWDVTHPLIIAQIERDIQYFLDAGFEYIKLDFISHGAMEGAHYDPSIQTGIQAYNQAMARIANQIDGRMFINLSIAPIFPHQYAHGRRIACDTFYSTEDTKYMLNSLTFGFWQAKIYACPDPDHILIWGSDGQASENEARARVTSGIIAASFLVGDDFSQFAQDEDAQARAELLLQNPYIMALARRRDVFQPAYFPTGHHRDAAAVFELRDGSRTYYAVFNFGDEPVEFSREFDSGIQVKELWSGEVSQGGVRMTIEGRDARVFWVE